MNQFSSDIIIVGAGAVGLTHAVEAVNRGLTVTILERDHRAVGASIRNFGHCCVTAQAGDIARLADLSRSRWLLAAEQTGITVAACGAYAVARSQEERAVLEEMAAAKGPGRVDLLDAEETRERFAAEGAGLDDRTVASAFLRDDLRVDPRTAVADLAAWLAGQRGVRFGWNTAVTGFGDGVVHTVRGDFVAGHTYVCVGHDLDHLLPQQAHDYAVERCALQMALVEAPAGMTLDQAVLTGSSMLRYDAFAQTTAARHLEASMRERRPELLDIGANVMLTRRRDGTLIVGDSHRFDETMDPFLYEDIADLLVAEAAAILGVESLRILQRWQGVYASSSVAPVLVEDAGPGLTAVSVTSGIGMTISFGLAYTNISALLGSTGDNRSPALTVTDSPIEVHHA